MVSYRWAGKDRRDTVERWTRILVASRCPRLVLPSGDTVHELRLVGAQVEVTTQPIGALRSVLASMPIGGASRRELTALVGDFDTFLPAVTWETYVERSAPHESAYAQGLARLAGITQGGALGDDLRTCAAIAAEHGLAIGIDWE